MESDMVVMEYKIINHPLGILESEWSFRPDGLFFEGAMITFQFTVGVDRELHPMQGIQNNIFG
jgi:hypothetical protein